jgi:hypothetical protein
MATIQIVYWRDIPAQVKVKQGRERVARQLSQRFQDAIDEAAMRAKLIGTDDYLAEWRTGSPVDHDGDLNTVADAIAADLEHQYPDDRLRALIAAGGKSVG